MRVHSAVPLQDSDPPSLLELLSQSPDDKMGAKAENLPDPKDQDPAGDFELIEVAPGQRGQVYSSYLCRYLAVPGLLLSEP